MKRVIQLICLFGLLVILSCQKGDDNDDNFVSYFKYNGEKYTTDFSLYLIQEINSKNSYGLSFYSSGIYFNYADTSYYGSGELIYLELTSNIFYSEQNEYSIYDLKENETININSGLLYLDSDAETEPIELIGGTLTLKSVDDMYFFDYKVNTNENKIVSGKFKGALLVVDYKYLKPILLEFIQ